MSIYTIGDLHLSFGTDKPMDIFGWKNHSDKIKNSWLENVKNKDTVIIPGDISWAMNLDEAFKDFEFINELPGTKIISKGNHDYWWNSKKKLNEFITKNSFNTICFLQNDSFLVEEKIIVGTRGWSTTDWNLDENYKILRRECERLKLSIADGIARYGEDKEIIAFLHYPPFYKSNVPEEIDFLKILQKYKIRKCYYAHLHGDSHKSAFEGEKDGIYFELVSSDYLDFKLKRIDDEK